MRGGRGGGGKQGPGGTAHFLFFKVLSFWEISENPNENLYFWNDQIFFPANNSKTLLTWSSPWLNRWSMKLMDSFHANLPSALLLFSNLNCHPTSSAALFICVGKLPLKWFLFFFFPDTESTDVAVADRLLIRGSGRTKREEVNYRQLVVFPQNSFHHLVDPQRGNHHLCRGKLPITTKQIRIFHFQDKNTNGLSWETIFLDRKVDDIPPADPCMSCLQTGTCEWH